MFACWGCACFPALCLPDVDDLTVNVLSQVPSYMSPVQHPRCPTQPPCSPEVCAWLPVLKGVTGWCSQLRSGVWARIPHWSVLTGRRKPPEGRSLPSCKSKCGLKGYFMRCLCALDPLYSFPAAEPKAVLLFPDPAVNQGLGMRSARDMAAVCQPSWKTQVAAAGSCCAGCVSPCQRLAAESPARGG